MKALFIGGTGVISGAAAELAAESGLELTLLNRGASPFPAPANVRVLHGDIRDPETAGKLLKGEHFDSVTDWVAFTPEHIRADLSLFEGKTAQFIFISSASAYQKPPENYLVTESTPLENPYYRYPQDKIACERLLMQKYRGEGFPVTIVRPSYTYSRSIPYLFNSKTRPFTLIDRIRRGRKILMPGDGRTLWTLTYAADFAKGFLGLVGNPAAIGEAYHITSDEVLTWDEILAQIAQAAGKQAEIVHVPLDVIGMFSPQREAELRGDKLNSLVFDNSKIRAAVPGYSAGTPFREGIRRAVAWFDAHPERCLIDEEFNALEDRILGAYERALLQIRQSAGKE